MIGSPYAPPNNANSPTRFRLLLVEDDDALRDSLRRMLARRFEVTALADASSVADLLGKEAFDIVLSDVYLGDVSGLDLLRLVRSVDRDVPVILMTGMPNLEGALDAMNLGALTYIKKPVEHAALDEALDRATKLAAINRAKRDANDCSTVRISNERTTLAASFERALDSMWIAFQPIVDGRSRATIGFEALMRSMEPALPNPGTVLTAAEQLGRIHDVGRCVRERAALAFDADDSEALLFVNLHAADLLDDDLFDAQAPLSKLAHRVVLEITERAALGDVGDARRRAAELRGRGFRIAIDDLGAGYSGLTSFALFEPEIVKLDMSLVRGIGSSSVKRMLVGRIAGLCRDLQMRVVAEGVETPEELACMLELGCEYVQGYLLGRPQEARLASAYPW